MKYQNIWKKMNKCTKTGLVSSLAYAGLSFVTPVLANNVEKPVERPVLQPLDLTQITTVEQAEQAYNERIKAYAEDKKITNDEITDLGSILQTEKTMLEGQKYALESKVAELSDVGELDNEIQMVKMAINSVDLEEIEVPLVFKDIKHDLNEKILCYYPDLIRNKKNPDYSVVYSASDPIEAKLNPVLKSLILKSDKLLKKYYNDATLEIMVEKESYTIKDVITFHEILNKERKAVYYKPEVSQKKQALGKKLKELENKKVQLSKDNGSQIKELDQKINAIILKVKDVEEEHASFKGYFSAQDDISKFVEEHDDLNKYMGFSVISLGKDGFLKDRDLSMAIQEFDSSNKRAISGLENYFNSKGFDVEIASLKNPAQLKVPVPFWTSMIFGAVFPVLRNFLSAAFIRRKIDPFDFGEGLIEAYAFTLFFDGAFPLLYPLRLFGMPFLLEPIRAATGLRRLK